MGPHVFFVFTLFLGIGPSACGSSGPTAPTAPPPAAAGLPTSQPATQATYTLSGVVYELTTTGKLPVEGVRLYCDSCGSPDGHTHTSSDANGAYSFSWARNGIHPLWIWKDGYDVIGSMGRLADGTSVKNATVNGDTRFDVQIVRR